MTKSDWAPAVFLLLLSLFVCQQSVGIGLGTFRQPGPGFLPFSAGALIGILGLWGLIQSVISKESWKVGNDSEAGEGTLPKIRLLLICLSLFAYTIAVSWLGFALSTFIFVLFIFRVVEPERWWRIVIKAVLITIGTHMLFVVWLKVNLPKGFLGWWHP